VTTPTLLTMLAAGTLDPRPLATHHLRLADIMRAYDTFGNAATERALKVILTST
jgi:alcohol dehydrogenase